MTAETEVVVAVVVVVMIMMMMMLMTMTTNVKMSRMKKTMTMSKQDFGEPPLTSDDVIEMHATPPRRDSGYLDPGGSWARLGGWGPPVAWISPCLNTRTQRFILSFVFLCLLILTAVSYPHSWYAAKSQPVDIHI